MGQTIPATTDLLSAVDQLHTRRAKDGGFGDRPGLPSRPDATAWAVLVYAASDTGRNLIDTARSRLVRDQHADGRVTISPDHHEAFWPTPLAILAWQGSPVHHEAQQRAVQSLLQTTGRYWKKGQDDPLGHNPALQGWPWIEATHSWVEPTALAILALTAAGHSTHTRVEEGVRLLLDRQLPHGGWNYGNTTVFGRELFPAPESTGAALHALARRVPQTEIQSSLEYLKEQVTRLRTPIALGWGLLGLQAWDSWPPEGEALVMESLKRQTRYGEYDTASLCLLLLPVAKVGRVHHRVAWSSRVRESSQSTHEDYGADST